MRDNQLEKSVQYNATVTDEQAQGWALNHRSPIEREIVTINTPDLERDISPYGAKQEMKDDADINIVMARMGIRDPGQLPEAADPRYYGDFTQTNDLASTLNMIREATDRFNDLPAKLRARFNNDPVQLWQFVNDPENDDEAVRLGLLKRSKHDPTQPPPKPKDPTLEQLERIATNTAPKEVKPSGSESQVPKTS